MLGFIIGLIAGAFIGVVVMAMAAISSQADRNMKNEEQ